MQGLDKPVNVSVTMYRSRFDLHVTYTEGWVPSWKWPMVGVTIALAVLIAFMVFLILVNRRQHLRLLHAMMPKKVLTFVRRGKVFTESFDCVSILFSDIVSYTTMSAQMEAIQVVQMLDELYQQYDNLTEKYQLYKVETIGDAFMVVGGAPNKEDSVAAAARVCQMALDMVKLTNDLVLPGGHKVQIRVGVHSGPAVAAVVGRKMPRYTLFGDTVNTASRMESNGAPMRIHVSSATAELLKQAGGFVVDSRGEIPVKGKGMMSTHWVLGSKSFHEGVYHRDESIHIGHITRMPQAAATTVSAPATPIYPNAANAEHVKLTMAPDAVMTSGSDHSMDMPLHAAMPPPPRESPALATEARASSYSSTMQIPESVQEDKEE